MANELLILDGTEVVLDGTGAATIAANAVAAALDANLTATDNAGYPYLRFALECAFATAPTVLQTIDLYEQPLNFHSTTNDGRDVSATFLHKYVGSFVVDAVGSSTAQFMLLDNILRPSSLEATYWLYNNTDQTINSDWDLRVTPYTFQPAA